MGKLMTFANTIYIVKKDEFKVGDLCVYVEIDSVLPEREEFEFLRDKNFRIKTMKMAGVISQGIGLKFVPIIDERKYLPKSVDDMLKYAHGKSALGDTLREGVVRRSAGGRKSFKAVDPLFLIKYNE